MMKNQEPASGKTTRRLAVVGLLALLCAMLPYRTGAQSTTIGEGNLQPVAPEASPAAVRPPLSAIAPYLVVGMGPRSAGEAITIRNGQEIGASRQTLSGGNPRYPIVSPIVASITPPPPYPSKPGLRSVFARNANAPTNPSKNRWLWDSAAQAHYLTGAVRLYRGVDWSGNCAVTSPTGAYSIQDTNVFGSFGFRTTAANAAASTPNSNYFAEQSLTGVAMQQSSPNSATGWNVAPDSHTQLLADLRAWRTYLRNLPRDGFFNSGNPSHPNDLRNRNTVAAGGSLTGVNTRLLYNVDGLDANGDGVAVIDVGYDGTDFDVSDSDWIITDSNLANGTPLVVFRIRGQANMTMSNASIMIGQGATCAAGLGALFVKVHPEEEFTSTSGSSDAVFNASNLVVNQVGFWDLNTIGDAAGDTDYPAPSDPVVYLSGSGGMPRTDYVNRPQQNNYTMISVSNGQGCTQLISSRVSLSNVRFTRCTICAAQPVDYGDAPDTGQGTGQGNYNTVATDNGPSHAIVPNLKLGLKAPDADPGTLQNPAATADDSTSTDDEDGVMALPSINTFSTSVPLSVSVLNNTGAPATLACWLDFNRDGDFVDLGERTSRPVDSSASQQAVTLTFTGFAPVPGPSTLRCRLAANLNEVNHPWGVANSGEVEDYQVSITSSGDAGIDYGDAPDPGPGTAEGNYNTRISDNGANHVIVYGLYLGSSIPDLDFGSLQNGAADADDTTGYDDEDGIAALPNISTQSTSVQFNVLATNQTAGDAKLRCFVDFDRNGRFDGQGEKSTNVDVGANTGAVSYAVSFTGFATPRAGASYIRCRIGYVANEVGNPTGSAYAGEVEDYLVTIQN